MEVNGKLHILMLYPQGKSLWCGLIRNLFCLYHNLNTSSHHGIYTILTEFSWFLYVNYPFNILLIMSNVSLDASIHNIET
jgi:hypothetical protein